MGEENKITKSREKGSGHSNNIVLILIAVIGLIGTITAAYIGAVYPTEISLTATASALATSGIQTVIPTGDPIRITDQLGNEIEPAFSFDGRSIVFIADGDGNNEIYTINPDGLAERRITETQRGEDLPTFSPDGQSILFGSDYNGNDELYLLNLSGNHDSINITNTPDIDEGRARFTPSGKNIIFDSNQTGDWDIYIGRFQDGLVSNARNLTNRPEYQDRYPTVSSLDNRVFFRSEPLFDNPESKSNLYSIQTNGTDLRTITSGSDDRFPSITADETWLTFQSSRDGNKEIYALNLRTVELRRLTDHPADDSFPSFSKDGRWIVFSSNRAGRGYDLYKIPFQP